MLTGRDYDDEKVSGVLMALNSRSFDETIDCNRISIFIDPTEIEREKKFKHSPSFSSQVCFQLGPESC